LYYYNEITASERPRRTTALAAEEAKVYLKVDNDVENEVIAALITTARLNVERVTRRVLLEQHWRCYRDKLPENKLIELGVGPVRTIIQAVYYDADGQQEVISANEYVIDVSSIPARVKFNLKAPHSNVRPINGYEIDFVAGYGTTTLDVPHDLRHAILMLISHWYENRSAVIADMSGSTTPQGVNELLQPYRVVSL